MDVSTIICDEILKLHDEEQKLFQQILLVFLLITIALLIGVSINCYLIKYQAKNLLPFHDTKLKYLFINSIHS